MNKIVMKKKIIILCGATGIGKTSAAIRIAKKIGGEIISADSMQIYKYMDIGSAKPTASERSQVKHHLIDFVDPADSFDAAEFAKLSGKVIDELYALNRIPVVAGGTGFYVKALLHGLFRDRPVDRKILSELMQIGEQKGSAYLHRELVSVDPQSSERVHENDLFRIIRALEVYRSTGNTISEYHKNHGFSDEKYDALKIGLNMDREKLYDRINLRVSMMLKGGFISEVKKLLEMGYKENLKPMQSIGYKQITDYLKGRLSLDEAERLMKRDSRRYAKRQLTWFRKDSAINWFDTEDTVGMEKRVSDFLVNK